MEQIINQLNTLFQSNQVISTVAGGSVVVWLVTNIKSIWSKLVGAITALVSFQIVNTYEDSRGSGGWNITDSQFVFNDFLCHTKSLWERTKNLDLSWNNGIDDTCGRKNIAMLAYGFSIRIMFGKIVFCYRKIEKEQKITVTTTLRVFFANKEKFMKRLSDHIDEQLDIRIRSQSERDYIKVFNGECNCGRKTKRRMDSIFTNNNEHYRLLESIQAFIDNKETYRKLSYPYSYSALLYGKPGCGKSSTILAIASALNKNITYVNLAKITLEKLLARLNDAFDDLIVFEDIDALTTPIGTSREDGDAGSGPSTGQEGEDNKRGPLNLFSSLSGVSLSEILNFTDGLLASDGTICLFTTNHIERLDPALLRAGRMNLVMEFTKLNRETAAKMIEANLGYQVSPHCFKDDAVNPADLQETILNIALGRETIKDLEQKFLKETNEKVHS